MPSPFRVAVAALAAVALAPAAAHAQSQYTVTFGWEPSQPTTAADVHLKATTTAPQVEWDFDADGHPDASGPQVDHRFTAGDHRVIVKATWPGTVPIVKQDVESIHVLQAPDASPTPAPTASPAPTVAPVPTVVAPSPPPPPPPCPTTVSFGKLRATGWCFTKNGSKYSTTMPFSINGIGIAPLGGNPVTIDTAAGTVSGAGAKTWFAAHGNTIEVNKGKVAWTIANDQIHGFTWEPAPTLGGMRITGMPAFPKLLDGGATQLGLYFALPGSLGGGTSASPVQLTLGGAQASGINPFKFTVPFGSLPGMPLKNLVVSYDGNGLWDINAGIKLPQPLALDVSADAGVKNGLFDHLTTNVTYGANGPHFGPVTLRRLLFSVELNPSVSACVPQAVMAQGKPALALCGQVGLDAGPKLLGHPALSIDGGLGLTVYTNKPSVFRAYGSVKIVGMQMGNATVEIRSDGYVGVTASHDIGWKGIISLKGTASLQFKGAKFNGELSENACLDFVHFCMGAKGLLSSKGIAVCLNVDTWLGDWHPGFGDKWGQAPKLYFSGCDVGPYRETLTAAAGDHSVRLGAGLPGATIVVTGKDAPPQVAFVGPHGERYVAGSDLMPVGGHGFMIMKSPAENLTEIAIRTPSPGKWRVEALPGSAAITGVKSADGLAKPSVHATVHGRKLTYSVKPIPGQTVTFDGIGTARGAHGTLSFSPAPGHGERRDVVALVTQDGKLRARIVVAHYRAPKAKPAPAVKHLKARRSGTTLSASWTGRDVEVTVALSDGRKLVSRPRTQRVSVSHVARSTHATVTVRSLDADGVTGRPTTVRV